MNQENINTLAELYLEKQMNEIVFKSGLIPKVTYEKVLQQIMIQIDKLEQTCYPNSKMYYFGRCQ